MAGKLKTNEVILQSPNGLVEKTITVGNDGVVTIDSINPMEKTLFKEYIATSAQTTVNIDGLDINTHKSYRVEIELNNTTSSTVNLFFGVNGNITNYTFSGWQNYWQNNGSWIAGYESSVCNTYAYNRDFIVVNLVLNNSYTIFSSVSNSSGGNSGQSGSRIVQYKHFAKTVLDTNITSILFSSNVTNGIGIGSKIRIYRGDL